MTKRIISIFMTIFIVLSVVLDVYASEGINSAVSLSVMGTDGNPVPNMVFGIYDADDKLIDDFVTDYQGKHTSAHVERVGSYYIKQVNPSEGYVTNTTKYPFSVTYDGETVNVDIEMERISGYIKITNTDTQGNPLPGVTYDVYDLFKYTNTELTTGADGTATAKLFYGTRIKLSQLSVPESYIKMTDTKEFSITEHGETVEFSIISAKISGTVRVTKKYYSTALSGVVYGIYDGQGVCVDEITTGADGRATTKILEYGNYELRELSTVEGYNLESAPIPFSITYLGLQSIE